MRLTIFLLITGLIHSQAAVYSQEARFTIHEKNVTLKKVLKEIESSSDYSFFYRTDQIDLRQKVDIAVRDGDLNLVLKQALRNQSLSYDIVGKIVVIKPMADRSSVAVIPVKGVVIDSLTHQPLPGVSVQVRGSKNGTMTNEKGEFSLAASDSAVLVISFVGYSPLELPVDATGNMRILLRPANTGLNEVVVVGYGTQKRSNLTGAVAQVDSKMLEDRPVSNVGQALQGVIANLNITFADGHPGSPAKLNIRGYTSLNGGSPLVVIDGVPGDLNLLNPMDVETISVLKDASSAAIYGGRAAYGVILITTRHGAKGKVQVNYTGNYSVATPTTSHEFMTDGYSTGKLIDDAFKIATGNIYTGYSDADYDQLKQRQTNHSLPTVVTDSRNGREQYVWYGHTDWWHFFMRNTMPSMNHAVSFSGANDNMDYAISGRYYQQKGLMQFNRDQYTSYNVRAKINAKMTSWLRLSENMQFTGYTYNFPGWGINNTFVSMGVHALPSYVPTNPDGTFAYRTNLNNYGIGDGIAADLQYGKSKGQQQNFDLTNIITITADITKDISLVGSYSYDLNPYSAFQRRAQAPWSIFVGQTDYVGTDSYNESVNLDQYHVINAYGNYAHSFNGHNIKVTAGYNQELKKYRLVSGSAINLLSTDLNGLDLGTSGQTTGGNSVEWALLGYFGRINYDYRSKYLLELNARYDGSSHFPAGNRFGFFPSISGGWRISEEPFFWSLKKIVSELKLRGSFGSLGNQSLSTNLRSSNYPYIPVVNTGLSTWLIGGAKPQYLSAGAPVSPDLTWEKIYSADGGVDIGLIHNHLNVSFDWYDRKTKDMLINGKTLPAIFGAGSPRQNAADLDTKGYELSINWQNSAFVSGKELSYNLGVVLSDSRSWITRFDNPSRLLSNHYPGERVGDFWGYTVDGYFKTDAEAQSYSVNQDFVNKQRLSAPGDGHNLQAGDMKFVDLTKDNIVNNGLNTVDDHGDLRRLGNNLPRYAFGITAGANWNGFDISVFFQGIGRQDWYPGNETYMFWGPYGRPYYSFIPKDFESKVWSQENPNAYFPKLRGYEALNANAELTSVNNRYLQNLAYLRLKNLRVGYSLPASLLKHWKITRVRLYFSGDNMFTTTALKTKYVDPEQVSADPDGVRGDPNARNYPFMKNYSAGLDITF
ncbi:MAG TPA: TonB-dependent receptor [Puia sp.]|nr:TonB-dependent receptor [Puia sp.]